MENSMERAKPMIEARTNHRVYSFKNLDTGEIYSGISKKFSSKYSLNRGCVSAVIKGTRKMHAGWVLNCGENNGK